MWSIVAALVVATPILLALITTAPTASASITTDRAKAHALEAKIAAQASRVQQLVSEFDVVDGHLQSLKDRIASDRVRLNKDVAAQTRASHRLQGAAVDAYINAASGNSSSIGTFIGTSNATSLPTREAYLGFASGTLDTAVATYQQDQFTTNQIKQTLTTEQQATQETLASLTASRLAVQSALNSEEATLSGVSENELALINAANAQREQERAQAAEAALAAEAAQQASSAPTSVTFSPTVFGRYSDPLRDVRGLTPDRVDQGVDFGGYGPIYAIGDGVVLSVVNGGWPGGTFICYRLTDGPASGLVVYAAEDINPTVQVGQEVSRTTVLGQLYNGPVGIETGWASPVADGVTMAASYGEFWGSNTTAFGSNFSQFLASLGAPGGQIQNAPTGSLPTGWPSW